MNDLILLSCEAPESAVRALGRHGSVLLLPPDPLLDGPVASHPDMLVWSHGGAVVMAREYLEAYPEIRGAISDAGVAVTPSDAQRGARYPLDVSLNCLLAEGRLFCRVRSAAPEIVAAAKERGLAVTDVAQGYAACSSLAAGDGIVTADPSVADAAEAAGLAVLRIAPGGIALPGYDSGFIGGASGVIGNEVFFFGDPLSHPDGERIVSFLAERGFRAVPLADGQLADFGGIGIIRKKSAGSF